MSERRYDCRANALRAFEHVLDLTHDSSRKICHCPSCLRQAEALASDYLRRLVPIMGYTEEEQYPYPHVVISQGNARLKVPLAFIELVETLKEDVL